MTNSVEKFSITLLKLWLSEAFCPGLVDNLFTIFNIICFSQYYLGKFEIPLVSNLPNNLLLSRSIRIWHLFFHQISGVGDHELVPDPEIVFSVLPRPEDSERRFDGSPVGRLLDEVADGGEHLVRVVHVLPVVEQRLCE